MLESSANQRAQILDLDRRGNLDGEALPCITRAFDDFYLIRHKTLLLLIFEFPLRSSAPSVVAAVAFLRALCGDLGLAVSPRWILSLQHSHFKLLHLRVQAGGLQRRDQGLPCFYWINDFVQPKAGRALAGIGVVIVCLFDSTVELIPLFLIK